MHATDIVGYTYQADEYHPHCLIKVMLGQGETFPAARDMDVETVLDQIAGASAIDRYDEHTFDSGEFPKVIFCSQVDSDDERCGLCGDPIL